MFDLTGKSALITGASGGIGGAIAKALHGAGANVGLSGTRVEPLEALAAELGERAFVLPCKLDDAEAVAALPKQAAEAMGSVDILVNNAGITRDNLFMRMSDDEWQSVLDVNLTGAARVLGHVLPPMIERDRGHIVLTGSLSGFRGLPRASGYGASKAGLMSLAETLYADLRGTGVDIQLVNPGFVKSRLTDKNDFAMPFIMDPEKAAEICFRHMSGSGFQRAFPRGLSWLFRGSRFLPDWLYYRLFA